ncbi:MAG: PHP domain-containing protein [Solirubrobacteraceae bacterium]|nr:PHP domain-containing protein [Solirubrobacteraceae bacterium]
MSSLVDKDGRPLFDLQSHSTWSDGVLPAGEVVERAAAAGVQVLALSDHDAIDGTAEALDAGAAFGVRVIPAVEISSIDPEGDDLHILGYDVDWKQPELLEALKDFRADREGRSDRMASALRELGWTVDDAPLEARKAKGLPIGRPHLAAAVFEAPENAARLKEEGLTGSPTDLLVAYLIEGKPAFRTRTHPTVPQAIDLIHAAGGVAVWAHPFWDVKPPETVGATIRRFHGYGIDGVEVFYTEHDRDQTLYLADLCDELGLITTGSADFHGPAHKLFSKFLDFELHGRDPNLGRLAG